MNKPISNATQTALNAKASTASLASVAFSGAKADIGLGSVENKSSATIRGELTSGNVTGALGFTPVSTAAIDTDASMTANSDIKVPSQKAVKTAVDGAKSYADSLVLAYTAENVANKVTAISGASTDAQYPSAKLLFDQLNLKAPTSTTATKASVQAAIPMSAINAATLFGVFN